MSNFTKILKDMKKDGFNDSDISHAIDMSKNYSQLEIHDNFIYDSVKNIKYKFENNNESEIFYSHCKTIKDKGIQKLTHSKTSFDLSSFANKL